MGHDDLAMHRAAAPHAAPFADGAKLVDALLALWPQDTPDRAADDLAAQGARVLTENDLLPGQVEDRRSGPRAVRALRERYGCRDGLVSLAQEHRLLRDWQDDDDSVPIRPRFVALVVRLTGAVDESALKAALTQVARRHESLRTTFYAARGAFRQAVRPELELPVVTLDVRDAATPADAQRRLAAQLLQGFDVKAGPLARAVIARERDDQWLAAFALEHLVSDGYSARLFWSEVAQSYERLTNGDEREPEPLAFHYLDWATWQRAHLTGARLQRYRDFWTHELAGACPFPRLAGYEPEGTSGTAVVHVATLSDDVRAAIAETARAWQCSEFAVALGALRIAFHRWKNWNDTVVHAPVHNRTTAADRQLIGWLANTLPLRGIVDARAPSIRAAVMDARERSQRAISHQLWPFFQLVKHLQPELYGRKHRTRRVFVDFQPPLQAVTQRMGDVRCEVVEPPNVYADPGLSLRIDAGPQWTLQLVQEADFSTAEEVRALLDLYVLALTEVAHGRG